MPRCVLCKEAIWNPVSPKMVIRQALAFLDVNKWEIFIQKANYLLNTLRVSHKHLYLDGERDVAICWGCMYEIIYELLLEIDKSAAKKFEKYCCPYGL